MNREPKPGMEHQRDLALAAKADALQREAAASRAQARALCQVADALRERARALQALAEATGALGQAVADDDRDYEALLLRTTHREIRVLLREAEIEDKAAETAEAMAQRADEEARLARSLLPPGSPAHPHA